VQRKPLQCCAPAARWPNPDLAVFHPADWSATRRIKDQFGRFMLAPDPSTDEVNTLWGIDVLVTTQNPVGKALLVDTSKFGRVAVNPRWA
jgi:HK97 family phage major capsid protein